MVTLIKALLFDFDGTLADTLPLICYGFREVLGAYTGREFTDAHIIGMFGPTEAGMLRKQVPAAQYEQAWGDLMSLFEAKHEALVAPNPGVNAMLDSLKEKGYRLGVFTGKGRDTAELSIEKLNLGPYFDVIMTGDDVVKSKPDPEGVVAAMQALGVQPEETVFIGDSDADIRAGKQARVRTVGVNWLSMPQNREFTVAPDEVFSELAPFEAWVAAQNEH